MAEKQHDGRPVSHERPLQGNTGRDIDAGRDKSAGDQRQPIEKVSNTLKPPAIQPPKPKG